MNKGKLFFVAILFFAVSNIYAQCPSGIDYKSFIDVVESILIEKGILIEIKTKANIAVWEKDAKSYLDSDQYKLIFKEGWVPVKTAIKNLRSLAKNWSDNNWDKQSLERRLIVAEFLSPLAKGQYDSAPSRNIIVSERNKIFATDQNLTQYFYTFERLVDPCEFRDRVNTEEKLRGFRNLQFDVEMVFNEDVYEACKADFNEILENIRQEVHIAKSRLEVKDPGIVDYDIGNGLFAKEKIKAGEVIGPYVGEVSPVTASTGYQMDALHYSIDAIRWGNRTRYINHATIENANVASVLINFNELVEPYLIVIKDIEPGQELLFDYGYDRFNGIDFYPITPDTRKR